MDDKFNRMVLQERWNALKQVYSLSSSYLITIFSSVIMASILFYFTRYGLIIGNLGKVYANTQVITQIVLSVLFGVNLSILWYKLKISSKVDTKAKGTTVLGSVIAIILSGCPACGVTLAGYLGLASFFSVFPFYGLEFKFVGIALLVYSTNHLLKNLFICKIK